MSREHYLEDVATAANLVHSNLFRAPYARATLAQIRSLAKQYKIVMWSIISRDHNRTTTKEQCLQEVLPHLRAGSIILFHDSVRTFENMSYALPKTLERIKELSLKCKTIEL